MSSPGGWTAEELASASRRWQLTCERCLWMASACVVWLLIGAFGFTEQALVQAFRWVLLPAVLAILLTLVAGVAALMATVTHLAAESLRSRSTAEESDSWPCPDELWCNGDVLILKDVRNPFRPGFYGIAEIRRGVLLLWEVNVDGAIVWYEVDEDPSLYMKASTIRRWQIIEWFREGRFEPFSEGDLPNPEDEHFYSSVIIPMVEAHDSGNDRIVRAVLSSPSYLGPQRPDRSDQ